MPPDDLSAVELLEQVAPSTVVLLPAQAGTAAQQRLRRARKLTARTDVAVLSRHRPVTRLLHAARMVLDADCFRPAEIAAAMDAVDASLKTLALLDSVAGLVVPVPSLSQHALGFMPGMRFLVDLDGGTVRRAAGRLPQDPRAGRKAGSGTFCATRSAPASWQSALVGLLQPEYVDELSPLDSEERCFWGMTQWAELTVLQLPEYDLLVEVRESLSFVSCPSCRRPAAGSACVFCGVLLHPDQWYAAVDASGTAS